ncbi:MAG: hypothetical protein IT423_02840, partial [Pirellulaceae bacterium]|nr:hypothetical protein [Pirellulaceae bacterium]
MNSVPRVLLVTRRFWPLAGDNAWRLLALATEMRHAGWHVEVVTALWHSAWPKRVQLREFDVQRIGPSPTTPFRTRRYTRAVWEWIAEAHQAAGRQGHPIDLVLIDSTEDETPALLARS